MGGEWEPVGSLGHWFYLSSGAACYSPSPSLDRPARVQLSDPHLPKCTSLGAGSAQGSYSGFLFFRTVLPVTRHYVALPWPEEWCLQFL